MPWKGKCRHRLFGFIRWGTASSFVSIQVFGHSSMLYGKCVQFLISTIPCFWTLWSSVKAELYFTTRGQKNFRTRSQKHSPGLTKCYPYGFSKSGPNSKSIQTQSTYQWSLTGCQQAASSAYNNEFRKCVHITLLTGGRCPGHPDSDYWLARQLLEMSNKVCNS